MAHSALMDKWQNRETTSQSRPGADPVKIEPGKMDCCPVMVSDLPVMCSRIDGVVTVVKAEQPNSTCQRLLWGKMLPVKVFFALCSCQDSDCYRKQTTTFYQCFLSVQKYNMTQHLWKWSKASGDQCVCQCSNSSSFRREDRALLNLLNVRVKAFNCQIQA